MGVSPPSGIFFLFFRNFQSLFLTRSRTRSQPSVWKAWEGLEEGAKLGELVVKTVKRKKPDGSVVEEQTMRVKPGVSFLGSGL